MKKVLIITYYFPPSGGPGVQRVLKFIKYLPQFGWEPVIFTVSNGQFLGYDESLLNEVPDTLKVYKSKTFEPYSIYNMISGKEKSSTVDVNTAEINYDKLNIKQKITELIRSTFFIPDARIGWKFTSPKTIEQIFREEQIDAVYSSSPPYTPALIGKYVKDKFRIPWLASFRDPWTGYKGTPKRWEIPAIIEQNMEKSVFEKADAVEVAWDGIIDDAINKYPNLNKDKFHIIYNGFDPDDIPAISPEKNSKFTVTYTGTLYTIQDPSLLFEAVFELVSNNMIDPEKIKFKFIGRIADEIVEKINQSPLKSVIDLPGYMPHKKAIHELAKTDATLLLGVNSKEKNVNVPGKTFEYIGLGKPIILIAPPKSKLNEIVGETGLGYAVDHYDKEGMKDYFFRLYNNWINNKKINPEYQNIEKHSRKNGAGKLAGILNNIT